MNHWKLCLHCWIPVSKKNDKKSVINQLGAEVDDLERSSVSLDSVPQPLPVPFRRSSAAVPYVEDSHFWTPPSPFVGNCADTSENYIPLDKCYSGPRGSKQPRSLPKLVPRDVHLLDLVPPSPCSLTENPGSLSGMPEVYAPMMSRNLVGPPSLSPRLASKGCDGPRRTQQVTPQSAKRDPYGHPGSEFPVFENSAGVSLSLKADLRNNNTCFNYKNEHGWLGNSRSDPRVRIAHSSISSEASLSEPKPCCTPGVFTLHSSVPDRPDCLPYSNVHNNAKDRHCVANQQSLPLTVKECREISRRQDGGSVSKKIDSSEPLQDESGLGAEALSHSLDSKILHMTPPAPLQDKLKAHKYVNANGSGGYGVPEGPDTRHLTLSYSEDTARPSTGGQSAANDCESYYNIIPTSCQSLKPGSDEPLTPPPPLPPPCHGASSSRKKPFQQRPHLPHGSPHRRSPHSVALPQRVRKEWSKSADDSSSSNNEEESSSGFSATNSNTSLNKPVDSSLLKSFTTKPPAPSQQPRIEYLQLDLDQPSVVTQGSRGSPGPIHRSQNSTIDYIEIDPCRTKALSDTKRQLESNRHSNKTTH